MSAPVFYPHLGPQNTKARYSPDKDKIRKELGIPLGSEVEHARTCMNGGKCTKQCECVTCKKFAEYVAAGTEKYDEEEKEEDAQGFGVMTEADLARHREGIKKGEYIPKPPPPKESLKEKNAEDSDFVKEIKNRDLGRINPPLQATKKDKRRLMSGVAQRREAFKKGPLADAQKELDCESCGKYQQELAELTERYARRGPGILGEEEQRHLQARIDPPEHKAEHESQPDRSPHGHTSRAYNASSRLEWQHGSVGDHHHHALHASGQGDNDLAARHHNLAADAHDAKSAQFRSGHADLGHAPDDFAARQHHHAAYLHRSAALAHTYPEETEKDSNEEAGKAIGGFAGGSGGAALGSQIGAGVDKVDKAVGGIPDPYHPFKSGIVPHELGGERERYSQPGVPPGHDAIQLSHKAHMASANAHYNPEADSSDHSSAAQMHERASAAHKSASRLVEGHDQISYHDMMHRHHQQLQAHHTDIAETQG